MALGLATGSTMVSVYESLVRLHKAGAVDFLQGRHFQFRRIPWASRFASTEFSLFHAGTFLCHVNVQPRNIHIPDGSVDGAYDQYCASYEQAIRAAGGIDVQLLGIGSGEADTGELTGPSMDLATATAFEAPVANKRILRALTRAA